MQKSGSPSRRWVIAALLLVIVGVVIQLSWTGWRSLGLHAAQAALDRRDFAEARRLLEPVLKSRSVSGETLLLAAQAARRDGALDDAAYWLDAAERAKAVPEAVTFERDLLRLQSGRTEDAERFLEVCQAHPSAEQSPLILESLIVGGLQRLDLQLAQRCLLLWQETCVRQPERIQGWIWQGEIALRRGDVDTAAQEYRRAVEAEPHNDKTRLRLAELLVRYAPREALNHLEPLRKKLPRDRDVLYQLARSHRALGQLEPADELLAQILEGSPDDFGAILERGHIAMESRNFAAAEPWYRAACKIHPEQREPNLALARCLQLQGKDEESQRYRDKVTQIDARLDEQIRRLKDKGRLEE